MQKPSERIADLQRRMVDLQMEQQREELAKPENGGLQFLMKVTGSSDADLAEARMRDPWTMIAAILYYLDEQAEPH